MVGSATKLPLGVEEIDVTFVKVGAKDHFFRDVQSRNSVLIIASYQ